MARVSTIQTNFTAGELSTKLHGRVDISKYANGAATIENMIVQPHGGVTRRPGTRFVKEVKISSAKTRLVPFEFSTTQAYVIEFGNLYMRFYKDQGAILEANTVISGATRANPVVITDTGHGYSDGDEVYISGVVGMTELNGKYYLVANKNTNDFELTDIDGANIDGTGYTAYSSAGTAARVYTLTTTFLTADIPSLQFAQSADVLYVAHPSYAPKKITRSAHTTWTIADITFTDGPYQIENITTTTLTAAAATGAGVSLTASAVAGINGGDGFKSTDVGRLVSIGVQATAWAATTGYSVDDIVRNSGNVYKCIKAGTSDSSGGPSGEGIEIVDATVTWKYLADGGIHWGYATIASFASTTSVTVDVVNDFGGTSAETKWRLGAWSDTTGYPATVAFYEQRLFWAGSSEQPQTLWGSKSGDYENHTPGTLDDEPVIYTLATDQVNVIRWLSPGKVMAIGTVGGEFIISGSTTADPLTPTNVRVVREGTRGSYNHRPIRIDNVVLFIQRAQRKIREFVYQFESDAYMSPDLTILSDQVSKGGIDQIAYQQELSTVVWAVKGDGQLVGMTYLRDQQVVAWHRHKIAGTFAPSTTHGVVESICVIPGTGEDELWMIVKRTVDSVTRRYVEFLENQFDVEEAEIKADAFYVDSGLTLNDPKTITGATVANPCVISSTAHGFSDGDLVDISDVVGMTELNGNRYRVIESAANSFEIMAKDGKPVSAASRANPGNVEAIAHGFSTGDEVGFLSVGGMTELDGNGYTITKVDADNFTIGVNTSGFTLYTSGGWVYLNTDASAFTTYTSAGKAREAVATLTGLEHLEGETVQTLGNGSVYADRAVASGAATSYSPEVSIAQVGLGYTSTVKTLRPEAGSEDGTAQGKTKRVFEVILRFVSTLGAKVGPNTTDLDEIQFRSGSDPTDSSPPLFTGDKDIRYRAGWRSEGQLVVQQSQPLPMHLTAIIKRLITSDG
jgi:hypothetical protein|tara:strand:- start:158 stop:3055 length:2898 start_codon:yes stop_codon:yes gene_type:complete